MAQSNFKAILDSRKNQQSPAPASTRTKKKSALAGKKKTVTGAETQIIIPKAAGTEKPLAKSKDPDFIQGNFYIRKTTHAQVKIKLLQEGKDQDLSDLVEELLSKWLSK